MFSSLQNQGNTLNLKLRLISRLEVLEMLIARIFAH